MRASELTQDERWFYMPKWKKTGISVLGVFVMLLSCIDSISF